MIDKVHIIRKRQKVHREVSRWLSGQAGGSDFGLTHGKVGCGSMSQQFQQEEMEQADLRAYWLVNITEI